MSTLAPSDRKIEANRQNAQKSTGPKTPEGKARSSMNALKHGLRSASIVVEGEDHDDYARYRIEMIRATGPNNVLELEFVEQIIRAGWKLRRLQTAEVEVYRDRTLALRRRCPNEAVNPDYVLADMLWGGSDLSNFQRYERQLTSMMHRATEQLRKLQKASPPQGTSEFAERLIALEQAQDGNAPNEANGPSDDVTNGTTDTSVTDELPPHTDASDPQRILSHSGALQRDGPDDFGG